LIRIRFILFVLVLIVFKQPLYCQNTQKQDSAKIFQLLSKGFKIVYSDAQKAKKIVDSAVVLAEKTNYDFGKLKSYNVLGIVYDIKGKNDSALSFYRKSIAVAVKIEDKTAIAQSYNNIGLIYWNQHQLDSALWYYNEASELFKKGNNPSGLANGYNNLGLIYDDLNDDSLSKVYFLKAFKIYNQLKDTFGMGASYSNIGRIFYEQADSAIHYNLIAIKFMKKVGDLYGLSRVYNNLGHAAESEKNFQKALDYFYLSLEVKKSTKDLYGIASTHKNLYSIYDSLNLASKEGFFHLKLAQKISEKENYMRILPQVYYNLGHYFNRLKQHDSAFFYADKWNDAYQNVFNKEKEEKISELKVTFDVERKKNQIASLTQEKKIEQLKSEKRKTIIFLLSLGFLLIVVVGVLYFINFKNQQKLKHQKAITKQKEKGLSAIIEATENERSRIAKDLHDGVGQQLAAIKLQFGAFNKQLKNQLPINLNDVERFEKLVDNTSADVRNISHEMMPKSLQDNGLIKAIEQLLENTLKPAAIHYNFEHFGLEVRLKKKLELALFRILQELLKNIINHANAKEVAVQLINNKKSVIFIVEDNGIGMEKGKKTNGIGLLSLKSRVSDIKGEINFEPSPISGTLVTLRIPLT